MKDYLCEKEVSEMTGIPVSQLRADRKHLRGLPTYKIRRNVFYKRQDVEEFAKTVFAVREKLLSRVHWSKRSPVFPLKAHSDIHAQIGGIHA